MLPGTGRGAPGRRSGDPRQPRSQTTSGSGPRESRRERAPLEGRTPGVRSASKGGRGWLGARQNSPLPAPALGTGSGSPKYSHQSRLGKGFSFTPTLILNATQLVTTSDFGSALGTAVCHGSGGERPPRLGRPDRSRLVGRKRRKPENTRYSASCPHS